MQAQVGSDVQEGATGGFEFETHSLVNQYPESIYGKMFCCLFPTRTILWDLKIFASSLIKINHAEATV